MNTTPDRHDPDDTGRPEEPGLDAAPRPDDARQTSADDQPTTPLEPSPPPSGQQGQPSPGVSGPAPETPEPGPTQTGSEPPQPTPTTAGARQATVVRTGTIVWGVLVLVFCAIVLQRTLAPATFDPVGWTTAVVLGIGALLLVVAVAVILRGRR